MSDDLIAAHRDTPKLMPYLHLPFQAGSDRILAAMNRKHTAARLSRPRRAASAPRAPTSPSRPTSSSAFPARPRPNSRRRSSIVARGRLRPGLLVQVQPASGHAGREHGRPGPRRGQDRAAGAPASAARRASSRRSTPSCVGRTLPVLFERPAAAPGQLIGRSPYLQSVHAEAPPDAGRPHRSG